MASAAGTGLTGTGTGLNVNTLTLTNIGNYIRPATTPLNNSDNFPWNEARAHYEASDVPIFTPEPKPEPEPKYITPDEMVERFSKVLGISPEDTRVVIENLNPAKPLDRFFDSLLKRIPKIEMSLNRRQGTYNIKKTSTAGSERNIILSDKIGKGAYGDIYISSDRKRVYKLIKSDFGSREGITSSYYFEVVLRDIFFEIFVQTLLSSDPKYGKFIAPVQGVFYNPSMDPNSRTVLIQMPTLKYNLHAGIKEYVESRKISIQYIRLRHILKSLTEALVHFKKLYNFYHGDLYSGNIMFSDNDLRKPMIIDFGRSCLTFNGITYTYYNTVCESNDMLQLVVDILQKNDNAGQLNRLYLDEYTTGFLRVALTCARPEYNFYGLLRREFIHMYPSLFNALYYSNFHPGKHVYDFFSKNGLLPLPYINTSEDFLNYIQNNDKREIEIAETPARRQQMGPREANILVEKLRGSTTRYRYPLKREAGTRRLIGGGRRRKRTQRR